jgi:threonine 3-dehydrogenase
VAAELMKSLVYDKSSMPWDKSRGFELRQMPKPVLDESSDPTDAANVIVKVIYAGFCGSDRGIWNRVAFKGMIFDSLKREKATTRIIGHEMVGEIVDVGSGVPGRFGYRPKDIVSTESHIICGTCYQCRIGETHICEPGRDHRHRPGRLLCRVHQAAGRRAVADGPAQDQDEGRRGQEPFGNAVHSCTTADLRGKTVAVFGCGTIGLFAIMVARALGATRVVGIEPVPANRKWPASSAPTRSSRSRSDKDRPHSWSADKKLVKTVRDCFGGIGADVSMEMAGFNSSVNNAIQSTRRGGDVILFGLKQGNFHIQAFDRAIVNGLRMHGVIGRRIFETWYIARNLLEDRSNGIQDKIAEVILGGGDDAVVHIDDFDPASFEKTLAAWPKPLIQF